MTWTRGAPTPFVRQLKHTPTHPHNTHTHTHTTTTTTSHSSASTSTGRARERERERERVRLPSWTYNAWTYNARDLLSLFFSLSLSVCLSISLSVGQPPKRGVPTNRLSFVVSQKHSSSPPPSSLPLSLSPSLPLGGVTRQGVALTDLQPLVDLSINSSLSLSLSLSHSLTRSLAPPLSVFLSHPSSLPSSLSVSVCLALSLAQDRAHPFPSRAPPSPRRQSFSPPATRTFPTCTFPPYTHVLAFRGGIYSIVENE